MKIRKLPPDAFSLSDSPLLGQTGEGRLKWFIRDLFDLPFVVRLDLEPRNRAATLTFDRNTAGLEEAWDAFRAVLPSLLARASDPRRGRPPRLFLQPFPPRPVRVFRYGPGLSTWQAMHYLDGRLRIRHAAIRQRPELTAGIQDALAATPGILRSRANHRAGSLTLQLDPGRISPERVPVLLEKLLDERWSQQPSEAGEDLHDVVALGSLLVAGGVEAGVEALSPLGAALVSLTGFPTVLSAFRRLKEGDIGSEAVEAFQILMSLLSGRYLPGALHALSVILWNRCSRETLAGLARTAAGRIPGLKPEEMAARLRALTSFPETEENAHLFAEEVILPMLLLGLAVGAAEGPEQAAAVLRTNFESGPLLVERLSLLTAGVRLGRAGVVLQRHGLLEAAAAAEAWVVRCPEAEPVEKLLSLLDRVTEAGKVVIRESGQVAHCSPGLKRFLPPGPLLAAERRTLVARLRKAGRRTGFLGGEGDDEALRLSEAALVQGADGPRELGGAFFARSATLRPLAALLAEARLHAARNERGRLISTLPNLLGSAGALFGLWGSLTNVVVSNLAVLGSWLDARSAFDTALGPPPPVADISADGAEKS